MSRKSKIFLLTFFCFHRDEYYTCDNLFTENGTVSGTMKPRDCDELLKSGNRLSGIHAVYVGPSQRPLLVYCDMETDGGGWTVCTL